MSDQRNLVLAIVLSVAIIMGFQFFYEMPRMREAQQRAEAERAAAASTDAIRPAPGVTAPSGGARGSDHDGAHRPGGRGRGGGARVRIDNGRLHGSVSLKGGGSTTSPSPTTARP
jgi:YidC/Oxa1 family membrane protein insertase